MDASSQRLKNAIIENFGTPCPVIDLDVVERNIERVQRLCDEAGIANRPHIKTHKSPLLAKMQIEAGAKGITCQKLGEAEVMADAGITDIVIATNLLGAARSGRLAALQRRVGLKVCADNPVTLSHYAQAAAQAERKMDVIIECDTGQKRAGVETPGEALALAQIIRDDPNLNFVGILFYPSLDGWEHTQTFFDALTEGLHELGMQATIVSTGGSPNLVNLGKLKGATEHRAGTCIFNDLMMINAGVATQEDCAFQIYSSVVSRAGEERGILDAGSKTLTSDTGGLEGYGRIIEHPNARIHKFAEEHGFLDLSRCNDKPGVGDIVRVIPNHVCVAVNMVDQLVAVRGDEIVEVIPVAARGRLV
ncbi:MAG: D-TA family PLP-dependent enzyme [Rhizobiaceae bacterium]|nr:D-TA family PLP-dependent enzyme [Hyphomicrobiales bacterium]NRB32547.1 D-TA family PLP-dependent enzyme [Rhizobiaceae bacterium]